MYEEQFPMYEGPPIDTSPRPFSEIPGLWLKVTQMTEEFFAQEAPRASGSNTLISVLIMAVISTVLSIISSLIWSAVQTAFLSPEYRGAAALGGPDLCSFCVGIVGTLVAFYLCSGLVYLGARVFGGTGDFSTQTYLASLFYVPLQIAAMLVSLVPCIGLIAALVLWIYIIVLDVRAVKVAHNLTTGRAIAAIFVPGIVVGPIMVCLSLFVIVLLALMGPAIGNIFENIVTNI
jgi:hypothetical protein